MSILCFKYNTHLGYPIKVSIVKSKDKKLVLIVTYSIHEGQLVLM